MRQTQKKRLTTIILLLVILVSLLYVGYILHRKSVNVVDTKTTQVIKEEAKQTPAVVKKELPKEVKLVSRGMEERDPHEEINTYIREICLRYPNVEPELVMSIVYHESTYSPTAKTGDHLGLMQLSTQWHSERAKRLHVTNFYDPYSNILLGVDYLSELFDQYKDPKLVLMLYNMNHDTAFKLYSEGKTSFYARSVLKKAAEYKKGK